MRRRILGSTGISVSELALGAMNFGSFGNVSHDDGVALIHAALDNGITLVDTADVYSLGESEEIVGQALKGRRDEVVLATKFGLPMGEDPNDSGGSPRYVRRAVEGSLRRLDTDHIDLYQMHRADHDTPVEETLAVLSDLVTEGKIRAFGSSTFAVESIVEAQWAAERGRQRRFLTEQPRYSIFNRTIEAAVLPAAQRYGMGVLTYAPLAGGWLAGRADPTAGARATRADREFDLAKEGNQAKADAVTKLRAVADEAGMSMAHLALAFVRAHPAVSSVLIGPRTAEQLHDLLAGADLVVGDDALDRIDEIVAPGCELNAEDNYFADPPALIDPRLRRR